MYTARYACQDACTARKRRLRRLHIQRRCQHGKWLWPIFFRLAIRFSPSTPRVRPLWIRSLLEAARPFFKQHNIRTYTISPNVYITDMNDNKGDNDTGSVVNLLLKDYSGDPRDVANAVTAMSDGTTNWKSGSNAACEDLFTYDVHERYKLMYAPESFGTALRSPEIPLTSLCNAVGEPVAGTKEELQKLHDDYEAAKDN